MSSTSPSRQISVLDAVSACLATLLFIALFAGHWLGDNSLCYKLLGCNAGFFGYDTIEHFLSGLLVASLVVRHARRRTRPDFLKNTFWRDVITLTAFVALFGLGWEMIEFFRDNVLMHIKFFHNIRLLLPDSVAQPSNSDTMGDLTFDLLGGLVGALVLRLVDSRIWRRRIN